MLLILKSFFEKHSKGGSQIRYNLIKNKHCGGTSIQQFADGTSSRYGTSSWWTGYKDIETCKAICSLHEDCSGFVLTNDNGVCGNWKKGPLAMFTDKISVHCYQKVEPIQGKKLLFHAIYDKPV